MFWRKQDDTGKKIINSSEYDECLKRISEIRTRVQAFEGDIEMLKTSISILRGNFNRKLKGLEEEEEKTKGSYTSDLIPLG